MNFSDHKPLCLPKQSITIGALHKQRRKFKELTRSDGFKVNIHSRLIDLSENKRRSILAKRVGCRYTIYVDWFSNACGKGGLGGSPHGSVHEGRRFGSARGWIHPAWWRYAWLCLEPPGSGHRGEARSWINVSLIGQCLFVCLFQCSVALLLHPMSFCSVHQRTSLCCIVVVYYFTWD